jgi:diaminohydroxyphosphoribosylaminopyrimidine deaminase / 5-amino-6-(5-phosphoribosylamino)uracil reductase
MGLPMVNLDRRAGAVDDRWMTHALTLAARGRGHVEPNPMVGCILVKDGTAVGEGWHQKFGHAHAEPNALAAAGDAARGATAYVTLEPCCHTNKKTPPCVPALVAAGVARVVVGCLDPNPEVNGRGVEQLRAAGIDVTVGVREAECRQLIAPFVALTRLGRPYVTLKWAQTADGKVAGPDGQRLQISGPEATRAVHRLRGRSDAIMVGMRTVLIDNPLLTARGVEVLRKAIRVVVGSDELPEDSHLARTREEGEVVTFPRATPLADVLKDLARHGVTHLLVESGPRLANAFLAGNLVDRVWVIRSPKVVDDDTAPAAIGIPYPPAAETTLGEDRLTEYLNPAGETFAANVVSPDFP